MPFFILSSFWTGTLFRGNSTETRLLLSSIPPAKRYYIYSGVIILLLLIQHSKVDVRTSHTSINVEKKDWSEHPFSHKNLHSYKEYTKTTDVYKTKCKKLIIFTYCQKYHCRSKFIFSFPFAFY